MFGKDYVLQCNLTACDTVTEKSAVITMRLSLQDLEKIEVVRALEKVDRTTLLKDFIGDGLRRRLK